jgi:hypothetical protein
MYQMFVNYLYINNTERNHILKKLYLFILFIKQKTIRKRDYFDQLHRMLIVIYLNRPEDSTVTVK